MNRFFIVTHGETTHHTERLVGGWYDSELTEKGIASGQKIANYLFDLKFLADTKLYCSDLKRTKDTGVIISEKLDLRMKLEKRLREMSFGSHEGISQDQHNKLMKPCADQDAQRMEHAICDGAETRGAFATRIAEFVSELDYDTQDHIFVTHGFVASFLIASLQRIPPQHMDFLSFEASSGSISELKFDDIFKNVTLTKLNMII